MGEIVARCLKKDPRDRYLDAADVARDLQELVTPTRTAKAAIIASDGEATLKVIPAPAASHWRSIALIGTLLLAGIFGIFQWKQLRKAQFRQESTQDLPLRRAALNRVPVQQAVLLPSCGMTGSPGKIKYGESARLRWSSSNAPEVVISPDVGIVGPNGNIEVSPRSTTTYEITATSAEGVVARGAVTIEVADAPASVKYMPVAGTIAVTPDTIQRGARTSLQWNSFGATRVVITPSIGLVPLSGNIKVGPRRTTTYTMTLTNDAGGYGQATAIVKVLASEQNVP
jgi:hypothetical protein